MDNSMLRRLVWPALSALVAAVVVLAIVVISGGGATEEASAQTVRFQRPTEAGPDPFTKPADVRGRTRIKPERVGQGPFGGTGSDLVCDRELLIKSLRARPDRLREWARVLGVRPTAKAVARYIRKLRPVTLTRDTRVTNHSFVDGRAVPFQAILQAGTAVLVDKSGKPVVRCRCGNPLLEPINYTSAECINCPPSYTPPPPCEPISACWRRYPNPPRVRIDVTVVRREPRQQEPPPPQAQPPPQPEPGGLQCDPPRSQLEFERCAQREGRAPQPEPAPEPEPQPPPEPEPTPEPPPPTGICNDGLDNEGVPGLIDGDDPNCQ